MKKSAILTVLGAMTALLMPATAHAHGGDVVRDYIHVVAAIFAGPVVCLLLALAAVSAIILRGSSTSRGRAVYGVVAIVLAVVGIVASLLILLQGGPMGFAYAAVVLSTGWWSIRLARRVVKRNSREATEEDQT